MNPFTMKWMLTLPKIRTVPDREDSTDFGESG